MTGPYRTTAGDSATEPPRASLTKLCLMDLDVLIDEHRWSVPSALVMTPRALRAYDAIVMILGGQPIRMEQIPMYRGIPIITTGTPDDPCIVGVLRSSAVHGEPLRLAVFGDDA